MKTVLSNANAQCRQLVYQGIKFMWQCSFAAGIAFLTSFNASAQTVTTVYSADTSFVLPIGVTNATVQVWGGGGRGGSRSTNGNGGGGGGGGAFSAGLLNVAPNQTYTVKVGAGSTSNSAPGGDSWVSTNGLVSGAVVLAKGGGSVANNSSTGANGGSAASGKGDVLFNGGRGYSPTSFNGGGGGSSAGLNANGVSATDSTGATAPAGGGNGGAGRTNSNGAGTAGTVPGGGGGGARRSSGSTSYSGGNGANGQVRVIYTRQATHVAFYSAPDSMIEGSVSQPIVVALEDASHNLVESVGATLINLGSSLSGAFRDAADINTITSAIIPSGQSSVTILYRPAEPGNHTLSLADNAGILNGALHDLNVRSAASYPAPVQTFYVPLQESDMFTFFDSIASAGNKPTQPMYRYIGIAVSSPGTIIYYDQMEDGYEAQIHRPTSVYHPVNNPSGTQVWGDGDLSNGVAPGFPDDLIPPGTSLILSNSFNSATAPSSAAPKFRAGDKIATSKSCSMSTTVWASTSTTLLSDMIEVFDTYNWGYEYVVPISSSAPSSYESFEYVGASLKAGRGGATIQIDKDANGTFETTLHLGEGQNSLVTGLSLGARFKSDTQFHVVVLTGDVGSNFESRWYPILPVERWESSYYTPVSTPATSAIADSPSGGIRTGVWLYNPSNTAITVTYARRGGGSLTNNIANKGVSYAAQNMSSSPYGNVYGPIVQLNNNGTLANTPEGAWIGIVRRNAGNNSVSTQVGNAQAAGAAAVIIANNQGTTSFPTDSIGSGRFIPVISTTKNGGDALFAAGLGSGWVRVSGAVTTSTVSVPARGLARQMMDDGYAGHFYTESGAKFYAISATDVGSSTTYQNQAWDWGFALVPESMLTRQALVAFGMGRDPIADENPDENGSPIWVTTIGNGDRDVKVYVDFDADPATGPHTDPYGNKYDLALTMRELELAKVYNPSGDQSGMLLYVIDSDVKITAAWGQDPLQATTGEPGFDAGTGIPPLPLFDASKKATFIHDNDGDGFISPGDDLEYEITIENISRTPIDDMLLEDRLPDSVVYTTNTTVFIDHHNITNNVPDHFDRDGFPFHEGEAVMLPEPSLPPSQAWVVRYQVRIKDFVDIPAFTTNIVNAATVNSVPVDDPINLDSEEPLHGRIGDTVWHDLNGNGLQDQGEPGVINVNVRLYDADDNLLQTKTTDNHGKYLFTGVTGGVYRIEFELPTGFTFTQINVDSEGVRGEDNSDAGAVTGSTGTFSIAPGEPFLPVDAGILETGSLGDRVWVDIDGNGIQDQGEPGLSGVTVKLLNADGSPYLDESSNPVVTVTDSSGLYEFSDLPPGDYRIQVVRPTAGGYVFSVPNADQQGINGPNNSDVAAGTGISSVIALQSGEHNKNVDAGLALKPGAIGDYVWLDENGDGEQDVGEDGIPNVKVELLNSDNEVIATTYTDTDGYYLFNRICLGTYTVRIDTDSLPVGLAANPTHDEDGTDTPNQSAVSIACGDHHMTADFGYNWAPPPDTDDGTGPGAIGDRVWIDANGNGVQDAGEPGMGGVTVQLYRDDDGDGVYEKLVETTTTDAAGNYIFDNLPAGAYVVEVNGGVAPDGYTQTGDPDHFGETLPQGEADNRTTVPIILAPGDVFVNADFGYQADENLTASIGDHVWFDRNADGVQDQGEPGMSGVSVALIRDLDGNGEWDAGEPIIARTVTDAAGDYLFTGVPVEDGVGTDDYLVWVNDTHGVLTGLEPTFDLDGTDPEHGIRVGYGIAAVTDLTPAGRLDVDFGYTVLGHETGQGLIGDTIFLDRNSNDEFDADEGLGNVTVELYAADGTPLLAVTMTNPNGNYWFGGLADATYVVKVDTSTLPNGGVGMTNTVDPDTPSPGDSRSEVVISGHNINLDQDFGYRVLEDDQPNSIGGTIWEDRDSDGTLSGAESGLGIPGVTVTLHDDTGRVVGKTVTDVNGDYLFGGLPEGTYSIEVSDETGRLRGWWHSLGDSPGSDNNSQVVGYEVSVAGGQIDTTADFGYFLLPAALGDFVWYDVNGNGLQDQGEDGIAGARVTLTITYSNSTVVTVSTLTDSNGNYSFGNLLLDEDYRGGLGANEPTYSIAVEPLPGLVPTRIGVGSDRAVDSDSHSGASASVARGETNNTYDFGYSLPARLYGYAFQDKDRDLVRSEGDGSVTNMLVQLWRNGRLIAYTNTSEAGYYEFGGLGPEEYEVRFVGSITNLVAIPTEAPADSDRERNRAAVPEGVSEYGNVFYAVYPGHGVMDEGEPVNAGFRGSGPMSSGIDLRAYRGADGVWVEYIAYDVEEDGQIRL